MDRAQIRTVVARISSYNIYTKYTVDEQGVLWLTVPGGGPGLEQKALATKYRDEIIAYLITPPESSLCSRGHRAVWQCSEYGVWFNRCYQCLDERRKQEQKLIKPASNNLASYWNQNTLTANNSQGVR